MSEITVSIADAQNSNTTPPPDKPQIPLTKADDNKPAVSSDESLDTDLCCCAIIVTLSPFLLLWAVGAWLLSCGKQGWGNNYTSGEKRFIHERVLLEEVNPIKKLKKVLKSIRSRTVFLVLLWLTLNLIIPGLRSKLILGAELWKWTLLVAMASCGYTLIGMTTNFLLPRVITFFCGWFKANESSHYFAEGLRESVNLIILSWSVLLMWVLYFRTSHGLRNETPDINVFLHFGTWTLTTLAIAAILWLLKNTLLLVWKKDVVYKRFRQRILCSAFQIYFVGHICMSKKEHSEIDQKQKDHFDLFRPKMKQEQNQDEHASAASTGHTVDDDEKNKAERKHKHLPSERTKLYGDKTIYDIMKMTQFFVELSEKSRKYDGTSDYDVEEHININRTDSGTSDVDVEECININQSTPTPRNRDITTAKDLTKFNLKEDDASLLYSDLARELQFGDSDKISFEKFQKSMVMAHKNCVALGHTLSDAVKVVKVLDNVMTGILILVSIIAWLLLTNIATNKILVLIASPFLAATFVFGDTCKKTFEGVVFSFINHPYDVGDRCIIDGLELEVKCMGIWTTTFIVIATNEEALYPNTSLATKLIINLKGETDPNDRVELKLDSSCKTKLAALSSKITGFFKDDNGKRFEEGPIIAIEEIGNFIRMTIQYKHILSTQEVTHSQCHEKKRRQRSDFLIEIAQYMDEANITMSSY